MNDEQNYNPSKPPDDYWECDDDDYCFNCDNEGFVIDCIDDLCQDGHCIHGDGERICPACNGRNYL